MNEMRHTNLRHFNDMSRFFEMDWPSTFFEKEFEDDNEEEGHLRRSSPKYEVVEKTDKFRLTIHLPDFNPEDINLELKSGGRLLSIHGMHQERDEGRSMSSSFIQNFTLDPNIQSDKMTAEFTDGLLIISAPKVKRALQSQKIPIKMVEGSYNTENKQSMDDTTMDNME
eukprot:CAMPEP_0184867504 /NCGR_PEP_ID=MMETSP0580-20130426/26855_1 /TAXON_ID=1118495 /ORGANISM="Dactyliosolen fragilissimus" /LENGTH=168 /DNA_ID=CAMNT_0027367835 /DNA_START=164 /DNA_END=670 /DNA_ORIENTATION=+